MSYNAVDKTTGNLIKIAGNASAAGGGGQYWATCNNQAANQIKIVTVSSDQNFVLEKNAIIFVKFDAANTYTATAEAPVKLNVNGTGDKNVYYANTNAPTGTNTTAFGRQNYINQYVYDGTNWVWQGSSSDNDTANKVVQTVTTGNANYEVLFSNTADNTTRTEGARKNSNLKFNPSTGNLQTTKINGVTVGNSPKFTDTVDAASLTYSNTTSGLTADDVQDAIDELVSEKKDEYTTITYAQWQALTPAQKAAKDYYISDYPSSAITAGNVSYNNSSSGMAANNVQGAVDELKSELNGVTPVKGFFIDSNVDIEDLSDGIYWVYGGWINFPAFLNQYQYGVLTIKTNAYRAYEYICMDGHITSVHLAVGIKYENYNITWSSLL